MKALWNNSLAGLKANLVPGLVLQAIGLTIVLIYYFVDSARGVFITIANLKLAYGYLYSAVATGIFGGLIPLAYLYAAGKVPPGKVCSWLIFFVLYWMWRGVEVDAFYRLQDWMFGSALDWRTVLTKVSVDQFLYCPFWSAPVTTICYGWKDGGFSLSALRRQLSRRLFTYEIPSVLLAVWIVWIPATSIIYSLPLLLQIPLFNLVLCFFVLLISALGKECP
ncbi:MAG: hypothetical protein R3F19_22545 [Verrucomicrobiales bacterium]